MAGFSCKAFALMTVMFARNLGFVECGTFGQVYDDMLTKLDIYGHCWFDAMQIAKSQCRAQTLSKQGVGTSGLLMYNCHIEKFESRRIECSADEDVKYCEALNSDIRKEEYRQLYLTFRNLYTVFCYHWTENGFPSIFQSFNGSSQATKTSTFVNIFTEWPTGFCSTAWQWTRRSLEELTCSMGYQLEVHFNSAYNHGCHFVSQCFESMEVFISDTWRKWKLFSEIMFTDARKCRGAKNSTSMNILAFLSWLESCSSLVVNMNLVRVTSNMKPPSVIDLVLSLLVAVQYGFEIQSIQYALNNCAEARWRGDPLEFMQNVITMSRQLNSALWIALVAFLLLRKAPETLQELRLAILQDGAQEQTSPQKKDQ